MHRRFAAFLFAALLIAFAVETISARPTTLVIEAENCAEIVPPMRKVKTGVIEPKGGRPTASATASLAGASGLGYVELPWGSGQGWRGKGGGHVVYRLDVPAAGHYRVWARTFWQDGCTNALFLTANKGARLVFGNDAVYGRWHWVKGQTLDLSEGINYLTFSNHSDGVALDKLEITNDLQHLPEGLGGEITRFYDGFAGCDADNTGSWEGISGKWRIVQPGNDEAAVSDCLAQWALEGGLALAGYSIWKDYDAQVSLMLARPGRAGILFYTLSGAEGLRLSVNAAPERTTVRLENLSDGTAEVLAEAERPGNVFDRWFTLGARRDGEKIVAVLDGTPMFELACPVVAEGRFGLFSEGGGAYFDNVEIDFRK